MKEAEIWLSEVEDRIIQSNEADQKKEGKSLDHKSILMELSDSTKCNNISIIVVLEEEEREKGTEDLFEWIIAENFPNQGKQKIPKSKRLKEHLSKSTKAGQHQDIL